MTLAFDPLVAWTPDVREMSPEQAAELAALGVVGVSPEGAGRWRIEPDSRVGVLIGTDWELRIKPRLAVPRLNFLLAYSWKREGYKDIIASFEEKDDVVGALASGFAFHAERALHLGVLHGYVHVEERRHDLRGRVRFGDQLARIPGLPLPLEVAYDDFAIDILENRMLKTAAEVLLRIQRIPPKARTRLLRIRSLLEDVAFLWHPRETQAPPITRLNERYEGSLKLAELILRSTSLDLERGETRAISFVFDMNKVFEAFLTAALEDALRPYGGWLTSQHRETLDVRERITIIPDLAWRDGRGVRAVIDAKYKPLLNDKVPNADVYQMLAYCIALGRRRGYLIYAKDSGEGEATHSIVRHGYEVEVRAVDVELEPDALLAQVDEIAAAVAGDWRVDLGVAA